MSAGAAAIGRRARLTIAVLDGLAAAGYAGIWSANLLPEPWLRELTLVLAAIALVSVWIVLAASSRVGQIVALIVGIVWLALGGRVAFWLVAWASRAWTTSGGSELGHSIAFLVTCLALGGGLAYGFWPIARLSLLAKVLLSARAQKESAPAPVAE